MRQWMSIAAIAFALAGLAWALTDKVVLARVFVLLSCVTTFVVLIAPRTGNPRTDDQAS